MLSKGQPRTPGLVILSYTLGLKLFLLPPNRGRCQRPVHTLFITEISLFVSSLYAVYYIRMEKVYSITTCDTMQYAHLKHPWAHHPGKNRANEKIPEVYGI